MRSELLRIFGNWRADLRVDQHSSECNFFVSAVPGSPSMLKIGASESESVGWVVGSRSVQPDRAFGWDSR